MSKNISAKTVSKKVATKKTAEVIAEVEEVMSTPEIETVQTIHEEPVAVEENEPVQVSDIFTIASTEFLSNIVKTLETLQKSKGAVALKTASMEIETQFRSACEKHFPKPIPVTTQTKAKTVRKKTEKDTSVPKKPLAAYIIFCGEHRNNIKDENPDMKFVDITRALGSKWNNLSEDEKAVYTEKHEKDVERYETEMRDANLPIEEKKVKQTKEKKTKEVKEVKPKEVKEKKTKEIKPKDTTATEPKRGVSAYISFCKEMRPIVKAEIPTIASNEILAELGRRWHLLTEEEKQPYKDMATVKKADQKEKPVEKPKAIAPDDNENELEEELEDE
jgi:hypothetical protein